MRIGFVFSSTRLLFGIDYADCLLGLYFGPIAVALAWGSPENNPFVSDEQLKELTKNAKEKR